MSLDGRITRFPADLDLYYSLAARWNPDAIIFGSSTILAAPSLEVPPEHQEMFKPPETGNEDSRPLMVVADSKGQVRCWEALRRWPYFRGFIALCSAATPGAHRQYLERHNVPVIITGTDRIDVRAALQDLNRRHGVRTVRVDSGGTLNSVFLQAGLVDELSVLIHPFLAGGQPDPTIFDPVKAGMPDLPISLKLDHSEVLEHGIIWARYYPEKSCK
jgi:2,5-diamino-6-(ribosylamino)-4(3H)-pyrimidinone 5'-phosphate reductase